MFYRGLFLVIVSLVIGAAVGMTGQSDSEWMSIWKQMQYGSVKEPVVTGPPFQVPSLEFKVTNRNSDQPMANTEIRVRYVWEWFEYPYPEHRQGAWSRAHDTLKVTTDEQGHFIIPEYQIVPRGWYKGKYLKDHLPKFLELAITVKNLHLYLKAKDILRIRQKGIRRPFQASRPDGFAGEYEVSVVKIMGRH